MWQKEMFIGRNLTLVTIQPDGIVDIKSLSDSQMDHGYLLVAHVATMLAMTKNVDMAASVMGFRKVERPDV